MSSRNQATSKTKRQEKSASPKLFDARVDEDVEEAIADISAWYSAAASPVTAEKSALHIPQAPDLIGISQAVYQQIEHLLRTKRHLLFYGPPGTGKTTLAEHVAQQLSEEYQLITASADWSSQDIIGGYQPAGGGGIRFAKGLLLEHFDKPIVIDELNRTDIDKVLGPLFTVLSGHSVTLPYSTDIGDPEAPRYKIYADESATQGRDHEFAPQSSWRLMATINTADKASLYQMSYALSRRFGWVFVDTPKDKKAFITNYLQEATEVEIGDEAASCPLADIWESTDKVRRIGPAPFIDIIEYCLAAGVETEFLGNVSDEEMQSYAEGYASLVVPMLDGITQSEAQGLTDGISEDLSLEAAAKEKFERVLKEVAV